MLQDACYLYLPAFSQLHFVICGSVGRAAHKKYIANTSLKYPRVTSRPIFVHEGQSWTEELLVFGIKVIFS